MANQGRLKIWTGNSHWFSVNLKPLQISLPKFQHFYNYERNEISPNLEGVAQKVCLLRPFEVLNIFGGKSISFAPRTFKFSEKRVSIEMYKWWNFGVDISNHFWLIGQKPILTFKSPPPLVQISSKWTRGGGDLKVKIGQSWIAKKWLEISTPKFHHLYISIETRFSPNLKVLGAKEMDFPPKMFKTSNGHSGDIFWATPSKFGEISFL